jgi:type II secretory pathway pseudopilin PulG
MLLFLMLAVAMIMITMLGVARNYRRGIQRDREVEMIHRGVQYARAVQRYYRKFGSYPTSIEQLENTNNLRFLRKKYKDPMSPDGEWKIAHLTDINLQSVGGLTPTAGTGTTTGTATAAGAATALAGAGATGAQTGSSGAAAGATSGNQSTDATASTTAGTSNPAGGTTSAFGSPSAPGTSATGANGSPVLGGGPVLGVVSKQKTEGIHSFGGKSKYNEWFFIYVTAQDTGKGRLLTGPYDPNMYMGAASSGPNPSGSGQTNGTVFGSTPSQTGVSSTTSTPSTTTPSTTTP